MTLRVLVIPEDPTLDQYILRPIVERMFRDLGRSARVEVLQKPRIRGVTQAMDAGKLVEIVRERRMFDLFLLMVDRDCADDRAAALAALEARHPDKLFGCLAVQEVEVWMLALHRDLIDARWSLVREDCHPKEGFATPFLVSRGWNTSLGRGRARAMDVLAERWNGLLTACPELATLRERLREHLTPGAP